MTIDTLYEFGEAGTTTAMSQAQQEAGFEGQVYFGYWNYVQNIYSKKINEIIDVVNSTGGFVATAEWKDGQTLTSTNLGDAVNEIVSSLAASTAYTRIGGTVQKQDKGFVKFQEQNSLNDQMLSLAKYSDRSARSGNWGYVDSMPQERINQRLNINGNRPFNQMRPDSDNCNTPNFHSGVNQIRALECVELDHPLASGSSVICMLEGYPTLGGISETQDMLTILTEPATMSGVVKYNRAHFTTSHAPILEGNATPIAMNVTNGNLYILWYYDGIDSGDPLYQQYELRAYQMDSSTGSFSPLVGFTTQILPRTGPSYTEPRIYGVYESENPFLILVATWIDQWESAANQTAPALIKIDATTGVQTDSGCGNMDLGTVGGVAYPTGSLAIYKDGSDYVFFAAYRKDTGNAAYATIMSSDMDAAWTKTGNEQVMPFRTESASNVLNVLECDGRYLYFAQKRNDYQETTGSVTDPGKSYLYIRDLTFDDDATVTVQDWVLDLTDFAHPDLVITTITAFFFYIHRSWIDGFNLWLLVSAQKNESTPFSSNSQTQFLKIPLANIEPNVYQQKDEVVTDDVDLQKIIDRKLIVDPYRLLTIECPSSLPGGANGGKLVPACFNGSDLFFIDPVSTTAYGSELFKLVNVNGR